MSKAEPFTVPANQPRRIILPTIGAEGFLQRVTIDQHGAVAVPTNIHLAGWFVGESIPGTPGLGIIDGHVQGKYAPGIFKHLSKLQPGDRYSIEYGDRSSKHFEVVSVDSYAVDTVHRKLFTKRADTPVQVHLITCGGNYNAADRQYDERVLVVSKLVGT